MKSAKLDLLIISTLVAIIAVPFLNKAFHWDDVIFLDTAIAKLSAPLDQHVNNYQIGFRVFEKFRDTNGPFVSYYLAANHQASPGISA